LAFALVTVAAGCGAGAAGPSGPVLTFDACAPVALIPDAPPTDRQAVGLAAAVAAWNRLAGTRLTLEATDQLPVIPVQFQKAAAPSHGLYDGQRGMIFINDDLDGSPLAVTVAHEIGHAFGLVHVDPADRRGRGPGGRAVGRLSPDRPARRPVDRRRLGVGGASGAGAAIALPSASMPASPRA